MANVGLPAPARGRTTLRVVGVVLLLLGAAAVVAGAVLFGKGALSDDMDAMGRFALIGVLLFGGGGVLAIAGLGMVSAGFHSTAYVPGETLVTDPTALFTDDRRLQ
ncbi:hypothetical protein SAMN04487968_108184 [Nocardioides terrae]|uniref:Uncharacterized protein n=1 Tax=Nocardioides terrae TaxID=574651 RepID=A0A1I1KJJ7_9ACTN|nr:hypothetical protein [Nocardioides terrae]SFC60939.1 hypothetical protein SAMN04487968_108184 [Nocardioides terrae]